MGRCSDCRHIVTFDEVVELPDRFLGVGEGYWCVRKVKPIQDPDTHIGCGCFEPDTDRFQDPPKWVPPVQTTILKIGVGESPVRCSMCNEYMEPVASSRWSGCVVNRYRRIDHPDMPRICSDYTGPMRTTVEKGRPYRPETPVSVLLGAGSTSPIGSIRPYEVVVRGTVKVRVFAKTPEGARRRALLASGMSSAEVLRLREVSE